MVSLRPWRPKRCVLVFQIERNKSVSNNSRCRLMKKSPTAPEPRLGPLIPSPTRRAPKRQLLHRRSARPRPKLPPSPKRPRPNPEMTMKPRKTFLLDICHTTSTRNGLRGSSRSSENCPALRSCSTESLANLEGELRSCLSAQVLFADITQDLPTWNMSMLRMA